MMQKVSIITPVYNADKYIAVTIKSVLAQQYSNFELIIIDDGSTDNSVKIIKEFMLADHRIKLLQTAGRQGAATARNLGIESANGNYIAFLDADDLWYPDKLLKQIEFMQNRDVLLCYSGYDFIDENGKLIRTFTPPQRLTYGSLLRTCSIGCLTAIYNVEILGKRYMPEIEKRQDYALWLAILKDIEFAQGPTQALGAYRVGKNSLSSNKISAARYQWKVYRQIEKLGFFRSAKMFCAYAVQGVIKHYF